MLFFFKKKGGAKFALRQRSGIGDPGCRLARLLPALLTLTAAAEFLLSMVRPGEGRERSHSGWHLYTR